MPAIAKKFVFSAQPALDKAIARQKACEQAVIEAWKALEAERLKLQRLNEEHSFLLQQIRALGDNLVSPQRQVSDPRELLRASASLDMAKKQEEVHREKIRKQQAQVKWAMDKVDLRKRELAEAVVHVQALEKLKENRRKEHETALAKAEEARRDDDSIQLWNAQQRERLRET